MKKVMLCLVTVVAVLMMTAGIAIKQKQSASIAIIGGADGPTSIFVAGKLGGNTSFGLIAAGVILLLGIIIYTKKKKRDR